MVGREGGRGGERKTGVKSKKGTEWFMFFKRT
jgi:hypothetical protein